MLKIAFVKQQAFPFFKVFLGLFLINPPLRQSA